LQASNPIHPKAELNRAVTQYEIIDTPEVARRLNLPETWIWDSTRRRAHDRDPIPCLRFGRYVRFEWLCPELKAWIERRRRHYSG
jgi:predicted DNA-binding transcriptional regulator AlpA